MSLVVKYSQCTNNECRVGDYVYCKTHGLGQILTEPIYRSTPSKSSHYATVQFKSELIPNFDLCENQLRIRIEGWVPLETKIVAFV